MWCIRASFWVVVHGMGDGYRTLNASIYTLLYTSVVASYSALYGKLVVKLGVICQNIMA